MKLKKIKTVRLVLIRVILARGTQRETARVTLRSVVLQELSPGIFILSRRKMKKTGRGVPVPLSIEQIFYSSEH